MELPIHKIRLTYALCIILFLILSYILFVFDYKLSASRFKLFYLLSTTCFFISLTKPFNLFRVYHHPLIDFKYL